MTHLKLQFSVYTILCHHIATGLSTICIRFKKVREAEEDLEIVTLLLANLALALDNLGNLDNLDNLDNLGKRALGLDTNPTLHLRSLFKEFGSSLRKLQVAPSGDLTNVMASL